MYAAGVRVFLEVGPQKHLSGLVRRILGKQQHLVVATNVKGRSDLTQLQHALAELLCGGVALNLDHLFDQRVARTFDPTRLDRETGQSAHPQGTWLVNGIRSRRSDGPEPRLLGQRWTPEQIESDRQKKRQRDAQQQNAKTPAAPADPAADHPTTRPSRPPQVVSNETETIPKMTSTHHTETNGQAAHPTNQPPALEELAQSHEEVGDVEAVMLGFQKVMAKFLDTQRAVMQQYLGGEPHHDPPEAPSRAPVDVGMPEALSHSNGNGQIAHGNPTTPPATHPADAPSRVPPASRMSSTHAPPLPESPRAVAAVEELPSAVEVVENGQPAPAEDRVDETQIQWDIDDVRIRLLELVAERTGYPEDMLDLELDLEADLGIDSIKRVEILGDLAETLGISDEEDESTIELEKLTTIRTLQGILEYLEETLFSDESPAATREESFRGNGVSADGATTPSVPASEATSGQGDVEIQRGLIELVEAPLTATASLPLPAGAVLISDDGRGVAAEIAERLSDFGQTVVVVKNMQGSFGGNQGSYVADLADETQVRQLVDAIHDQYGAVAGLIHLAALVPADGDRWLDRAEQDVRSYYLLCRALEDDLRTAGKTGFAFSFAATQLGGKLGFSSLPDPAEFLPGLGGILGFAKCMAQEWPEVTVRAVDFDPRAIASDVVEHVLTELSTEDDLVEVGYSEGRRWTWQAVSGSVDETAEPTKLDEKAVVILSGGARGITAAIAKEVAQNYRCQLILAGRSPVPPEQDADDVAELRTAAEIKAALIARHQGNGTAAAPSAVEAAYRQLMRDREIRKNLAAIRETGARVEYHSVDMRDEAAVAGLIKDVMERFGRVDGVIHGAGVIEDKLIRDKTPESFDRVFLTKVRSAWNLAQHLPAQSLRFCLFFSSIASRYGNKGQADYAAANEVLTKLATDLDRRWAGRVAAISWGPWSEIGMVSDLEKHLTARGVALIPPAKGTAMLLQELERGSKGETEVLIAGGAERLVHSRNRVETVS